MSKRIVMSVLSAAAMSIGGFFVSCGAPEAKEAAVVVVQMPEGCTLISPRDEMGTLAGASVAKAKPGLDEFVIACDGRMVQVQKQIAPGQRSVAFTADELR
jgi:hypothetical protein